MDELIKTIIVNEANFEHIAKSKTINGTLYTEIKRIMQAYAEQCIISKADCPFCGKPMKGIVQTNFKCKDCDASFTG